MIRAEPSQSLDERRRRLDGFANGAFEIMKLALAYDITPDVLRGVERDVALTMSPAVRAEMLLYSDRIDINVTGRQSKVGWWWNRRITKQIAVDVLFNPYRMGLSAWTDPDAPGGIVTFQ